MSYEAKSPAETRLDVTLPGNMRADVALPGRLATCSVLLDAEPATVTMRDGAAWVLDVDSGAHSFTCP